MLRKPESPTDPRHTRRRITTFKKILRSPLKSAKFHPTYRRVIVADPTRPTRTNFRTRTVRKSASKYRSPPGLKLTHLPPEILQRIAVYSSATSNRLRQTSRVLHQSIPKRPFGVSQMLALLDEFATIVPSPSITRRPHFWSIISYEVDRNMRYDVFVEAEIREDKTKEKHRTVYATMSEMQDAVQEFASVNRFYLSTHDNHAGTFIWTLFPATKPSGSARFIPYAYTSTTRRRENYESSKQHKHRFLHF